MLPLRSTSGWTTPAPAISRYVASPSFFDHSMSISTPGSTNGKYDGRKRIAMSSRSKNARQNCVTVALRSARLTPSSTHRPSTWWNIGEWVASWSWRYTRPGQMIRIGGCCDWIAASTRAFAWLMAAPAFGRSSAESFPSPLRSSVSEPDFPRKRAFACSRSAMLAVAVTARSASATMWSSSFINNKRGSCEPLVLFASLSGPEARFGLLDDAAERRLVEDREIGEDLAIDVDRRLLQARHELAVRDSRVARPGVDARDPEGAELALLVAAVAVGVLPRLHHRLLGDAIDVLAPAAEPLGLVEDFLVARARRDSA